ncbi:MAG: ion channel [Myxococcota bacterium]|nr:ion channel [Myxococcota bacterium]
MLGRYRYAYLLATLAVLIVARPFLPDLGKNLVLAMLGFSLVMAAVTSAARQYQVWVGVAMTAAIIFFSVLPQQPGRFDASVLSPALGVLYWAFTAFLILRRILVHTNEVSSDTINGAICVYLLMGLGWAHGYALLEALDPGSFELEGPAALAPGVHAFEHFIGFSFITLTTVGYGNMIPLTARAEAVAVAEAISGQLYLAVLLARLVAMEIVSRRGTQRGDD